MTRMLTAARALLVAAAAVLCSRTLLAQTWYPPGAQIDINRPHSPFDCDLPNGKQWYGSREVCLEYLCAGRNVYNEYIFDADNRRRKNPCYGQSPTDFGEHTD